ncbi:MAG: hypothetical protein COW30_13090 [Rhodospirillales bacterium CG15_BIG_FIL_POST_REV_8_21_14_020_66_15]|nr:MAG: hypothetical protein COW30_13090 [Rhodospirillales bacterium CG15_BIG_FIL_POST_REV_8_21_14_020_66_15]
MTKTAKSPATDLEKALLNPEAAFGTPEAVVEHDGLTKAQKIDILQRWEYDAKETCVAVEEGMPGGQSDVLGRILLALHGLGAARDLEQAGPSKQHGVPDSAVRPD